MKKQLDRIEAKLDEILRVETQLLKNTANVNGSKGLLQTIQAWSDSSKNGVCLSERGELVYDGTQSIEPAQDIIINNLPSEPDWSKAPEWAEWWAVDGKNGQAYWYEEIPVDCIEFNRWVWQGKSKIATDKVVKEHISDWHNSLRQRPKAEQVNITAHLHTDIDGYLAGKKSFISAYVDLLLARMANEGRFSSDNNYSLNPYSFQSNDVVFIEIDDYRRVFSVVNMVVPLGYLMLSHSVYIDKDWSAVQQIEPRKDKVRLITELEAVEFRKAMEAVYG